MFDEEEEGGKKRKCRVLGGTGVKSLSHFLYWYIILESNYLMNDSSSYELLALELDSIKPPGCRRANVGWREESLSRDHLATDSVWSKLPPISAKLPPLSVPVSPSPVSREASSDLVALDV